MERHATVPATTHRSPLRESRCRCGKVGSFGLRDAWYCIDHLPAEWHAIGDRLGHDMRQPEPEGDWL